MAGEISTKRHSSKVHNAEPETKPEKKADCVDIKLTMPDSPVRGMLETLGYELDQSGAEMRLKDNWVTHAQVEKYMELFSCGHEADLRAVRAFLESTNPLGIQSNGSPAPDEVKRGFKILLNFCDRTGLTDDTSFGGAHGTPLETRTPNIDAAATTALVKFVKHTIIEDPHRKRQGPVDDLEVQNYLGERLIEIANGVLDLDPYRQHPHAEKMGREWRPKPQEGTEPRQELPSGFQCGEKPDICKDF